MIFQTRPVSSHADSARSKLAISTAALAYVTTAAVAQTYSPPTPTLEMVEISAVTNSAPVPIVPQTVPFANVTTSRIEAVTGTGTSVLSLPGVFTVSTTELSASGQAGINRFTHFELAAMDSADLLLPTGATTLVNIVRDNRVLIDGTVSSLFDDGTIGGHLIFASPDGIVVGEGGSINAGALTLVTPTASYLDTDFSALTVVVDQSVTDLARGQVPLTASGLIQVDGSLFAPDGIVLSAPEISVGENAAVWAGSLLYDQTTDTVFNPVFDALVQTKGGITVGNALVERNGAIEIVAASDQSYLGNVEQATSGERPLAQAQISVDGTLRGDGVALTAMAKSESTFDQNQTNSVLNPGLNVQRFPFALGVVEAEGLADITVGATADIRSTDDVDINASTEVTTSSRTAGGTLDPLSKGVPDLPISIAITAADLVAKADAVVVAGASITAENNLTVTARNKSTVTNAASTTGGDGPIAAAFSTADVDAAAVIESGANLQANSLSVTAVNENDFRTTATSRIEQDGTAAVAFAFADTDSDALAFLGADFQSVGSAVSTVTVEASSITENHRTAASSKAADFTFFEKIAGVGDATSALTERLSSIMGLVGSSNGSAAEQTAGLSETEAKIGATTAVAFADQSAKAVIEGGNGFTRDMDGNPVFTDAAAPTVMADNVAVYAETRDQLIRNFAVNKATAKAPSSNNNDQAALTAALAFGFYDYDTEALVGEGTTIEAEQVGIGAESTKEFGFTLIENLTPPPGGSLPEIFTYLSDIVKRGAVAKDFGIAEDLFSSYAASSETVKSNDADSTAIAGSVTFTEINQNTRAWVGSGASITATGSTTGADFVTNLASITDADDNEVARSVSWWTVASGEDQASVVVRARSVTEGIHVGGAVSFRGSTITSDGTAIGGAVGITDQSAETVAGVADGAVIITDRTLNVDAVTDNFLIGITPTSGEGSGVTGIGLVNFISIINVTSASVSNFARVEAGGVNIQAQQNVTSWSVAAAAAGSDGIAVGLSGAINLIDAETEAFIGDNTRFDDDNNAPAPPPGPFPGDTGPTNKVITQNLRVRARTVGEAGTIAVAGSKSSRGESSGGSDDKNFIKSFIDGTVGGVKSKAKGLVDKLKALDPRSKSAVASDDPTETTASSTLSGQSKTLQDQSGGEDPGPEGSAESNKPKFGFALSGSAAANINDFTTLAYVQEANVVGQGTATPNLLEVQAVTDADQISVSGGAALSSGSGSGQTSAAISGAVAYQLSEAQNDAHITGSTLLNMNNVDVRSLIGGLRVGAALGLSAETGKSDRSAAVAGSFSISRVADSADARLADSSLTLDDPDAHTDSVNVDAYNRNTIGVGAGAVAYGGRASASGGVTYAEVDNRDSDSTDGRGRAAFAGVLNTSITDYDSLRVAAINAAQTISVGIVGGVTKQDFALAGAIVINRIDADAIARLGESSVISVRDSAEVVAGGGEVAEFDQIIASSERIAGREANEYDVAVDDLDFDDQGDAPDSFGTGARAFALAGAVSASKRASAGFALTINDIDSDRTAIVDGDTTSVTTGGRFDVTADNQSEILSLAISGAGATNGNAFAGSVSVNLIDDDTIAHIGDVSGPSQLTTIDAPIVDIDAVGRAQINSLAGGISVSAGNSAVGASIAVNEIRGTTDAGLIETQLRNAQTLGVTATTNPEGGPTGPGASINSIAIAGGVTTGKVGLAGSASANLIETQVKARIEDTVTVGSGSLVADVTADRFARIQSIAGALGVATSGAGVGLGVAVNRINGMVDTDVMGGNLELTTLRMDSSARDVIRTVGVGLGGGSSVGGAGSVVVNVMGTDVRSRITDGAIIVAENNVGVNAFVDSEIEALAGAIAVGGTGGIGLSSSVNIIDGETTAEISGAATQVTAKGNSSTDVLTVRTGELQNPLSFTEAVIPGIDVTIRTKDSSTFDETTKTVRGLSVTATALRETDVIATAASVAGKIAGAANAAVNVVTGTTQGLIVDATINPASGGDGRTRDGDVNVKASTHTYGGAYSVGLAAAGLGGVVGSAVADSYETVTIAKVDGATIAADDISIKAASSYTTANVVAGAGAGLGAGVAAGGVVTIFDATTVSQLIGGNTRANSLDIAADSDAFVGGFGLVLAGGAVGAAGTFNVLVNESTTEALIGRRDTQNDPEETTLVESDNVDVAASTDTIVDTTSAAGAIGGGFGIAGSAAVVVSETQTIARIETATVTGAQPASSVDVTSVDSFDVRALTAGAAVSAGAGAGAGINVVTAKSKSLASVDNSTITTGTFTIDADGLTDIDLDTYALGAGLSFGVSGSVAVIKLGGRIDSGAQDEISGTLTTAETTAADSSDTSRNRALSDTERAQASGSTYDVDGETFNNETHVVAANVRGSTINAGTITVTSDAKTATLSEVGSAAAGGIAGLGAAISFTTIDTGVAAGVDSGSTLNATGPVTITAASGDNGAAASDINALVGAAGLGAGLGAANANAEVTSRVAADLSGVLNGGDGGRLTVSAADTTTVNSDASGLSVGLIGAAGVVVARAEKLGEASATIGNANNDIQNMLGATVSANAAGGARATAQGASGGIGLAVQGTVATATENTRVQARVRDDSTIALAGTLNVDARSTPSTFAEAKGVAVAAGAGVGVSVAEANVGTSGNGSSVTAEVGDSVDLTMVLGGVDVAAGLTVSGRTAEARATGSAGGLLFGAQASLASVDTFTDVTASIGDNVDLAIGGVSVLATKSTNQFAQSSGQSGGFVSVGASDSEVNSGGDTLAEVGDNASFDKVPTSIAMPSFRVNAGTSEITEAVSISGSGGVIAGSATDTEINSNSSTMAKVGNTGPGGIRALDVNLGAVHEARFRELADASSAGLAGKSGAVTNVNLNNSATIEVGDGFEVTGGIIDIRTNAITERFGDPVSVKGGAGGLGAFAAADGNVNIDQESKITIGNAVKLVTTNGFNLTTDNSDIRMDALRALNVDDHVVQRASGALAVPTARLDFNADIDNAISIGSDSELDSDGGIYLGVAPSAQIDARASTKTSAGIGATEADVLAGTSSNTINIDQAISVGARTLVSSERDIRFQTGANAFTGTPSRIDIDITSDAYNSAAIPISTTADATLNFSNDAAISVGTDARLESLRDIILNASRGETDLFAEGQATYVIGLLFGVTVTDRSGDVNERGEGSLSIGGSIEAGYLAERSFVIDADGNVTVTDEEEDRPLVSVRDDFNPLTEVRARIAELEMLRDMGDTSVIGEIEILRELERFLDGDSGGSNNPDQTGGGIFTQVGQNPIPGGQPGPAPTGQNDRDGAIQIRDVTAASGNVEITADRITSANTASVTSNGGPIIEIINRSGRDLIVGNLEIFDASVGEVRFLGAAGDLGGITPTEVRKGERSVIRIDNSPSSFLPDNTSDLYITGDITNSFGIVDIDVARGDLLQTAVVNAGDLQIDVPEGGYFAILPDGLVPLGPDASTRFEQYIILEQLTYLRDNFGNLSTRNIDDDVRRDANLPVLFGPEIVDSVGNIRSANDFAQFMAHYLGNPTGSLTDPAFGVSIANGLVNADGSNSRLGSIGRTDNGLREFVALYDGLLNAGSGTIPLLPTELGRISGGVGGVGLTISVPERQSDINFRTITASRNRVEQVLGRRNEFANEVFFSSRLEPGNGLINVGGTVGVFAKSIDISGTVISGRRGERSFRLTQGGGNTLQTWIDNPGLRPVVAPGETPLPENLIDVSSLIQVIGGDPREKINAVYDLDSQQIILDNVYATGGGNIILNGEILSTTGQGNLIARNGRGQVQIDNLTGFDIQLNDIDVGVDTRGIVQITDKAKPQLNGNFLTTYYVQEAGQPVQVYTTDQPGVDFRDLDPSQVINGDSATYAPRAGIALQYFEEQFLIRNNNERDDPNQDDPRFVIFAIDPWAWADQDPRTGQSVILGNPNAPYFQQTVSGELFNTYQVGLSLNGERVATSAWPVSYRIRRTQTVRADNPITVSFEGNPLGVIDVTSASDIRIAGTLNNPTGLVRVNSTNGQTERLGNGRIIGNTVALEATGAIGAASNPLDVFITDGGALEAFAGLDVGLQVIGQSDVGIRRVASLAGDIDLRGSSTAFNIGTVSALDGNVLIENSGDLIQTSTSGAAVSGDDISLTSVRGRIGDAAGGAFRIDSGINDGVGIASAVRLSSNGDLIVEEVAGSLRVAEVEAINGNATLIAMDGDITNAFSSAEVDENQVERLNAAIDALLLGSNPDGSPMDDGSDNIIAFESRVAIQYTAIARIREKASVDGNNMVTLTTEQAVGFAPQYAASVDPGRTFGSPAELEAYAQANAAEIRDFVQAQYDDALDFLTTSILTIQDADGNPFDASTDVRLNLVGTRVEDILNTDNEVIGQRTVQVTRTGITLAEALAGPAFDDGMFQTATVDVVDGSELNTLLVTGVTFSDAQLQNQLAASAVEAALEGVRPGDTLIRTPSTQVFDLESTIFADNVTLITGGSVGGTFDPIIVEFPTGTAPTLTPFTRALLATASPGDVLVEFDENAGLTRFIVSPANPLYIDTGVVNANAAVDVFLGSNEMLTLGSVVGAGNARIFGRDGIAAADFVTAGTPSISATDLIIESALGAIGSADRPLEVSLAGAMTRAGAETGVFIRDLLGDFSVGNIYSNGDINLWAPNGGILSSIPNEDVHLEGDNIRFEADGDIGVFGQALGVRGNDGTLIAISENGAVNLRSPETPLRLLNVQAGTDVDIASNGDLTVEDEVSGGGNVVLASAGGDLVLVADAEVESRGGNGILTGNQLEFDASSSVSTAGDLSLNATSGGSKLGSITAGGTLTSQSVEETLVQRDITSGDEFLFDAGGVITMVADTDLVSTNGGGVMTGHELEFDASSSITTAGDLSLGATSGGATLAAINAGGALSSQSVEETLIQRNITSGDSSVFDAGGTLTMLPGIHVVSTNGGVTMNAADIAMGSATTVTAAGVIGITSAIGDVVIGTLTSTFDGPGAIMINSAGAILPTEPDVTNIIATMPNAQVRLDAVGDIGSITQDRPLIVDLSSLTAVTTQGDIYIIGLSGFDAPLLSAVNGSIKLRIDGTLTFGEVLGEPDIVVTGSLIGDRMVFENGIIAAGEEINVGLMEVGQSVILRARDITSNILYTDSLGVPLTLSVTGFDPETEAETVTLDLDSPRGVFSPTFYATSTVMSSTGSYFEFVDGRSSGDLLLTTPDVRLAMDNVTPAPRNGFDIQLYQPNRAFFAVLNGKRVLTDAYVLHYLPGILDTQVTIENYDAISVRRNMQLVNVNALSSDPYGLMLERRDHRLSEIQRLQSLGEADVVESSGPGPAVNVGSYAGPVGSSD
ncbi:MAG: leukotoxin LktA family filamentous adhesin [Pseudomonadota bacterium]